MSASKAASSHAREKEGSEFRVSASWHDHVLVVRNRMGLIGYSYTIGNALVHEELRTEEDIENTNCYHQRQ